MFLDNRHSKIYHSIVTSARVRGLQKKDHTGYYEWHHIIPTSLGGANTNENKALLTAREHFLCHLLLTRMTTGRDLIRMKHAFSYMALCHSGTQTRRETGRWYALAREMAAQSRDDGWKQKISVAHKGRKKAPEAVEKMRQALTGRPLTAEHRAKISANSARLMAKPFTAISPEGLKTEGVGLRGFCTVHDLDYQVAWGNLKKSKPVAKGKNKGWRFTA